MLKLVRPPSKDVQALQESYANIEAQRHHAQLLAAYLQSHVLRNHSPRTIAKTKRYLHSWFKTHGNKTRDLYTWEAMAIVTGRKRIVEYGQALIDSGLTNGTIREYFTSLRGYFEFVLSHPFIADHNDATHSIRDLYGPIEQPITEYDIPIHGYGAEFKGLPFDAESLFKFFKLVSQHYLKQNFSHIRARNYAMIVLAGETGLRADEIAHLEIKDLFFDSHKVQTRFAKANRGSGKRARQTLFPPFARDTLRFYLSKHRIHIQGADKTDLVFPSKQGTGIAYSSMQLFLKEMVAIANRHGFSVLSHMSWHWFRRIFATRFIETFPDQLPVLISLLGHTSPNTVHSYIHHSKAWMNCRIQSVLEKVECDEY